MEELKKWRNRSQLFYARKKKKLKKFKFKREI